MTLTINLETMSVKEKMLLVGEVLRSCECKIPPQTETKEQMLEQSLKEQREGARMIPLEEVDEEIRRKYE